MPWRLECTILAFITKVNTDTWEIGLMEKLWKVVESIINTRLQVRIQFHDILHGFRAGRGKETATIDIKLSHELARSGQYPIFLFFLNLRKANNRVYRSCPIRTMEGYGAVKHMYKLLVNFWDHQEVVTIQNKYHGPNFKSTRGTAQGELIYMTLFNVVVDNLVRMWLAMTVEDQVVAQEGLGLDVRRSLGFFYTNDGRTGAEKSEWIQNVIKVLITLFRKYGIIVNVAKYQTMTCQPRALRLGMSEEVVGLQYMGVGLSYCERLQIRISCP